MTFISVRGGGSESVIGDEQAGPRKARERQASKHAGPRSKKAAKDVSTALRTVYDDTLREEIPDDFRDLLDKLR